MRKSTILALFIINLCAPRKPFSVRPEKNDNKPKESGKDILLLEPDNFCIIGTYQAKEAA